MNTIRICDICNKEVEEGNAFKFAMSRRIDEKVHEKCLEEFIKYTQEKYDSWGDVNTIILEHKEEFLKQKENK